MRLCPADECAEAYISQRKHYIEILVHIPMMEKVMTVQFPEEPAFFEAALFWEMHAPVEVFVNTIVAAAGGDKGKHDCPHCPAAEEDPDKQ